MQILRKVVSEFARKVVVAGSLIALCQPMTAQEEEGMVEEVARGATEEATTEAAEAAEAAAEVATVAEEGATLLGDFRLTYYCCENYRHICGMGTGVTASGRPVEAGRSIAVDPELIPLGSRVWIDFGDGEGWHEYSADDVGSAVEDYHIDIAIATHREALSQTKLTGRVCFCPPPE